MDTTFTYDDGESPFAEYESPTALSTLNDGATDEMAAQEWAGVRCERCDAPIKSDVVSICRACGWYASLGTYVELDPAWETEEEAGQRSAAEPAQSHVQVWLSLLPPWAWIVIGTMFVVLVESVAVRLATPAGSWIRTAWSLAQLTLGALIFLGCHVLSCLVLAADDAEIGLMDIVLKPLKIWTRVFRELPARLWIVDAAAAGLMAAVMSLVVIGGIPYEKLWDWGFEQPPKQNLMGAVMSQMQKLDDEGGADNLEDAVGDFAGSQGLDEEKTPPKPREETDCVILGYRADREGRIHTLILGAAHRGQLVYAGTVTPHLDDEEMAELAQRLAATQSKEPFVRLHTTAIWVRPTLACRVSYGSSEKDGRLLDLQWEEMLGGMRLK